MSTDIDDTRLDTLRAIADHLIPAAHGMPSAGDIIDRRRLDMVLGARPDLGRPLAAALAVIDPTDPAASLEVLATDHPDRLGVVQFVVVAGYYTDDRVKELIGYPGQVPKPVNAFDFPEYLDEGLIDAVMARGQVWREVPPT